MIGAKYSYDKTNGYGGPNGENAPFCQNGFKAVGKLCITLPIEQAKTIEEAKEVCSTKTATLYTTTDPVQHNIMSHMMKEWVSTRAYLKLHALMSAVLFSDVEMS